MEITVKIDCPALDRLAQVLALHLNGGCVPPTQPVKPSAEIKPTQPVKPSAEIKPISNPVVITLVEARAALNDLRASKGAAAVRAVLDQMGVKSFTDLKTPDELARAVQLAQEAMA